MTSQPSPVVPDLTRAAQALALLGLMGASLGMAVWSVLNWANLVDYFLHNRIGRSNRWWLIGDMIGFATVACCMALVYMAWPRTRGLPRVEEITYRLAPLAVVGLVPMLLKLDAWLNREVTFLIWILLFGFGLRRALFTALQTAPLRASSRQLITLGVYGPRLVLALGVLSYALYFSWVTVTNHHNLRTGSFDLGIENNLLWNLVNDGPWFKSSPLGGPQASHFGFHATLFSFVIGLLYRFTPHAETLLMLQACLIAAAALPLFLIAQRRLGEWSAALVALAYLLYAPVHGANLYDFHYQPLSPFFLWMTLWCVDSRRPVWAGVFVLLSLSIREDIGLVLGTLGLYLILSGWRPRAGLVLTLAGLGYFCLMKLVVMPRFAGGAETFINQYQGLLGTGERGFLGIGKTLLGNPGFVLQGILTQEKLIYFLQIMTPLLFLPLLQASGLICCIAGFVLTLLSTGYTPLYQLSFQYTAYWTACLFPALVFNLAAMIPSQDSGNFQGLIRQRSWLVAFLACLLITSHQYGAVLQRDIVRGGFFPYRFGATETDRQRYSELQTILAQIPADAKVAAPDPLVSHISSRADAYGIPPDYFDAEYLLFMVEPVEPMGIHPGARTLIRQALISGQFGVSHTVGPFVLARRGYVTTRNEPVLMRLP